MNENKRCNELGTKNDTDYKKFLKSKEIISKPSGFDCDNFNENLFEWQADIVKWALKKGKAALFEDCGLGKTFCQLEWAQKVHKKTNKPVIIFAPLSVAEQTKREAVKFGIDNVKVVRDMESVINGINVTNYEILEHFDCSVFSGVVLDESSILKSYTSKTKQLLVDSFKDTPYKLCCTATPAPNDYMEMGNHADFLGIMSRAEMLATFFVHDGGDTAKWRLKGHAKKDFFAWVASWACCLKKPSDIGYNDKGFELPQLNVEHVVVETGMSEDVDGQLSLVAQPTLTLNERRKARTDSIVQRVEKTLDLCVEAVKNGEQILIWCDLNSEQDELEKRLGERCFSVRGATSDSKKIEYEQRWRDGERSFFVTKPKIFGYGLNWQNCNNVVFCGLSDSFENYYQAVRRCWRYGQEKPVNVWIVTSENEGAVKQNVLRKQKETEEMQQELIKYTQDILTQEIRCTTRETETYIALERVLIPVWLKSM